MNTLFYTRMVRWSFFGVRGRVSAGADLPSPRPALLAMTAILLPGTFVQPLITVVRFVIRS